jgi:hypothetical protein
MRDNIVRAVTLLGCAIPLVSSSQHTHRTQELELRPSASSPSLPGNFGLTIAAQPSSLDPSAPNATLILQAAIDASFDTQAVSANWSFITDGQVPRGISTNFSIGSSTLQVPISPNTTTFTAVVVAFNTTSMQNVSMPITLYSLAASTVVGGSVAVLECGPASLVTSLMSGGLCPLAPGDTWIGSGCGVDSLQRNVLTMSVGPDNCTFSTRNATLVDIFSLLDAHAVPVASDSDASTTGSLQLDWALQQPAPLLSTADASLSLDAASFNFAPSAVLGARVTASGFQSLTLQLIGTTSIFTSLHGSADATVNITSNPIILGTAQLGTYRFMVDIVPIVVVPTVQVSAYAVYNAAASVSAQIPAATVSAAASVGFAWTQASGFTSLNAFDMSGSVGDGVLEITGTSCSASVSVVLSISLSVALDDLVTLNAAWNPTVVGTYAVPPPVAAYGQHTNCACAGDGTANAWLGVGMTAPVTIGVDTIFGPHDDWEIEDTTGKLLGGQCIAAVEACAAASNCTAYCPASAFLFSGQMNNVIAVNGTIDVTQSYTHSAWVNPWDYGNDIMPVTCDKFWGCSSFNADNSGGLFLHVNQWQTSNGIVCTEIVNTQQAGCGGACGGQPVPLNTWTLITNVFDASTGTSEVFFNGQLMGSGQMNGVRSLSEASSFYIGSCYQNDDGPTTQRGNFDGLINDVTHFTYAMTAQQVLAFYQQKQVNGSDVDLMAWYPAPPAARHSTHVPNQATGTTGEFDGVFSSPAYATCTVSSSGQCQCTQA